MIPQLSANFLTFKRRHWWQSCYVWAGKILLVFLYQKCWSSRIVFSWSYFIYYVPLVDISFEVYSAFSLDWRPIRFRFAVELSHSSGLPAILQFCQVRTWFHYVSTLCDICEIEMQLIICKYFRRCLPPIRSYIFLPLILVPWIAGAACKYLFVKFFWMLSRISFTENLDDILKFSRL